MIKENKPKVSIITPSYNQGQFIEETINSVLNQTYNNIEYIVLDSLSTDNTPKILKKYQNKITKIVSEKDKGQSDAINKGFELASGEIIGWINSDDLLYSDCVEKIISAYKSNSGASIYYNSNYNIINAKSYIIKKNKLPVYSREYLLRCNFNVLQPGSFYNRKMIKEVNYLDEDIHYCMDLDLWLKLLKIGDIIDINENPTAAYREWEFTKTSTGAEKFYKNIFDTLRKHGANLSDASVKNVIKLYFKNFIKSKLKIFNK